jgi:hypothetical protein
MDQENAAEATRVANLEKENAELRAKLAQLESQRAPGALDEETEKEVRVRIGAGLTREQALEVVHSQQAWDKKVAEEANAKAKKK